MHNLFEIDEWKIYERSFDSSKQVMAESIFSIGNGAFGQRANFEETYSGETMPGNYVGGVYYPDKTRVGWWKNGYPEYFAKVLNSCNWIGIDLEIDGVKVDVHKAKVKSFYRELDMKEGVLTRSLKLQLSSSKEIELVSKRFCSMQNDHIGAISYSVTPLNFSANVKFEVYLDCNVTNHDSNYGEIFWKEEDKKVDEREGLLSCRTKISDFVVSTAMRYSFWKDHSKLVIHPNTIEREMYVSNTFEYFLEKGTCYTIKKYVSIVSSLNHKEFALSAKAILYVSEAYKKGFNVLLKEHINTWKDIWNQADILIEGDVRSQQAIRFNIFQLFQSYTGRDSKLNIGPKGFTGEKYGGATYWDTEAFCMPFYLKTSDSNVAKQLLLYRFNQLDKAIENAEKLGFSKGAALFPMVTMNGEECHNEWEITFEEIHRNGAIAFAIYNYLRHTNDEDYLRVYGKSVLVAISRFWFQRFNWSEEKGAYVMLGVTGPNEYENNVNNNWYTNYIAKWCIQYTLDIEKNSTFGPSLITEKEKEEWEKLLEQVYLPQITNSNIFLQQDGFLDKKNQEVKDIPESEKPINQHWSWDRILRSIFIKQADVLQGIYMFEEHFTPEQIKENFDYYEPKTVHESSLSPCVHAIIASKLGYVDKAYELFQRTARLDLDDYNKEVKEGLHITSMAGTWLSIVEGFGGLRISESDLSFAPKLPKEWKSLMYKIRYKGLIIQVFCGKKDIQIQHNGSIDLKFLLYGKEMILKADDKLIVKLDSLVKK